MEKHLLQKIALIASLFLFIGQEALAQGYGYCGQNSAILDINTGELRIRYKTWNRFGSCHESMDREWINIHKFSFDGGAPYDKIFDVGDASVTLPHSFHLNPTRHPNSGTANQFAELRFTSATALSSINSRLSLFGSSNIYTNGFRLRIHFRWNDRGGNNCSSNSHSNTSCDLVVAALPTIPAPSSFNVSDNTICDYVQISWSGPSIVRNAGSSVKEYELYRDNVLINAAFQSEFRDYTAVPGQSYQYKVRTVMKYPNNVKYYGAYTNSVTGSKYGPPGEPRGLFLEQPNCAGELQLNWSSVGALNPQLFVIERSQDSSFTQFIDTFTISGNDRQMRDQSTATGSTYYYQLRSEDACPNNASQKVRSGLSNKEGLIALGIPSAPAIDSLIIDTIGARMIVQWQDRSNVEQGYKLIRQSGNTQVEFDLPVDANTYVDNSANTCETYTYSLKIFNTCAVQGINSTNSKTGSIPVDVGETFFGNNQLSATDGELGDRIDLKWRTPNGQNENWNISRIELGIDDTVAIANIQGVDRVYSDYTAESNKLYKYIIQGESQCGSQTELSNISTDVGFRLAFGTANGQVSYSGGSAVKGVKIEAQTLGLFTGNSGNFTNPSAIANAGNKSLLQASSLTFIGLIRPTTLSGKQIIAQKGTGANGWSFGLNSNSLELSLKGQIYSVQDTNLKINQWLSVGVTVSADSIRFYSKGRYIGGNAITAVDALNITDSLLLGGDNGANNFSGYLDDLRMYNKALSDEEVRRSFDVFINPSARGLVGYWRFDEGFGNTAFDYSKTLQNTNKNNATVSATFSFDTIIPSKSLLNAGAYTDSLGSYFIPFIPYTGAGSSFSITPTFGIHSFTPRVRSLFIGPNNPNYSGVDFTDNSAFQVTGLVKYENTSCFQGGVIIKIDGEVVIENGAIDTTDNTGAFDIEVPIGPHVITVEKAGHEFSRGRFPLTGAFDFQNNLRIDSTFLDGTLMRVVGRVAGGPVQEALPPAMGRGKNNIGVASIPFTTSNTCFSDIAKTDSITGEYSIELPPIQYTVAQFAPSNNPLYVFNSKIVDLTATIPARTETDTLSVDTFGVATIDSATFSYREDFIHRNTPVITVLDTNQLPNFGQDTIAYETKTSSIAIPVDSLKLTYPVFKENRKYYMLFTAFEEYTNNDTLGKMVVDKVPVVDGTIRINNGLARGSVDSIQLGGKGFDGTARYDFTAGQASTVVDTATQDYSFTRTLNATLITGNVSVPLTIAPPKPSLDNVFRGVIFGGRGSGGQNFVSSGPSVVTMILRDPPGSQSFSTWDEGTSQTRVSNVSSTDGVTGNFELSVQVGTNFSVGVGYETSTEAISSIDGQFGFQRSVTEEDELVEEITVNSSLSTSADIEFVGAHADIFVGRAYNVRFGLANVIRLIELSTCLNPENECLGDTVMHNGIEYRLGRSTTLFAVPEGDSTTFFFTASNIEGNIIPDLISLRNAYLSDSSRYENYQTKGDEGFGLSNDDPFWGPNRKPKPFNNSLEDSIGSSYRFKGYELYDTTVNGQMIQMSRGIDSVWVLNQQVRLWKEALARNEREKVLANSNNFSNNISFGAGISFDRASTTNRTESNTTSISYNLNSDLLLSLGTEVAGIGFQLDNNVTIDYEEVETTTVTNSKTTTFSYHLEDLGDDDRLSVDVYNSAEGFGPIFKTAAGNTSCPHEEEVTTSYYSPIGTVINVGTVRQEIPEINASPATLFNVPSEGEGVITLTLTNAGTEDNFYDLQLLEASNPNGAILKIDGANANRSFFVPAGTSITKTLIVEKGPSEIAYENLGIVFHSQCQYASATANFTDIADTAYFSVNFLPACTDVGVLFPLDQFVVNNEFNDTLPVILYDYDINQEGLKKINLQYKPSAQSSWITLPTEWFIDSVKIRAQTNPSPDARLIPSVQTFIQYEFDMAKLIDQSYQIRAASTCAIPNSPDKVQYSEILTGTADRVNPTVFGTPSPADGVLDPNDEISIRFNETIKVGALTADNFLLTGVLNRKSLGGHEVALGFDGISSALEISDGFNPASNSFTVEFYAKRNALGTNQTILSQGTQTNNEFYIGFNSQNKLELKVGNKLVASAIKALNDSTWVHYSVSYNKTNGIVEFYIRDAANTYNDNAQNFFTNFNAGGKTFIGKRANNTNFLEADLHEVRVWNRALSNAQIVPNINNILTGREAGLIAYYPMDEGRGDLVADKARFRNASSTASWTISPSGYAAEFDQSAAFHLLRIDDARYTTISSEENFTIELWFKTQGGQLQTLFSNGSGKFHTTDLNENSWSIEMTASNQIEVRHDSVAYIMVSQDFADNEWHHFALVVNRQTNMTAYIDAVQQNTASVALLNGFNGREIGIGARYIPSGLIAVYDQLFTGKIDEIRMWNSTRTQEELELSRFNKLDGGEFGLELYYPLDEPNGLGGLQSSYSDVSGKQNNLIGYVNIANLVKDAPPIIVEKQLSTLNYNYVVNKDEIIFTLTDLNAEIENTTVNISVKEVQDLNGNVLQSPQSWIAFVNKNQVLWQDAEKNETVTFGTAHTFSSSIANSGGSAKNFTISNVPTWLSVSPASGVIQPLSTQQLTFTVNSGINIGNYTEDLLLATDFGYDEKLQVNLEVRKSAPDFTFDANLYSQSMSIIAQIRINGTISTNDEDILIAYSNNEIRGAATLQYFPQLDRYMAFLDVYANGSDSITFKVWNALEGELHEKVTPGIRFSDNSLRGSIQNPQLFDAINTLSKPIVLNQGWNWVSFPMHNDEMRNLYFFFENLNSQTGDQIKTIGNNALSNYTDLSGWGDRLAQDGLTNEVSYLLKVAVDDTLMYEGTAIDPDTMPISVVQGWNRIGFVSTKNIEINTALANYNATDGDVIKSQQSFSVYSSTLGWIGSLTAMEPTEGYLLKSVVGDTFTYPARGLFRLKAKVIQANDLDNVPTSLKLNPNSFEASTGAIADLSVCSEMLESKDWYFVAYHNDEIRGVSNSPKQIGGSDSTLYFMTIYGNGSEEFNFKLVNPSTLEEHEFLSELTFQKNQVQGKVGSPIRFELLNEVECETKELKTKEFSSTTYPNPFINELTIVVPKEISPKGNIELLNTAGKLLLQLPIKERVQIRLTEKHLSRLGVGVFQLKFIDEKQLITEKIIRIK